MVYESISIELTKTCNLSCAYCYANAVNRKNAEIMPLPKLYAFFEKFRETGGRRILLTGGEVTLIPQIEEIICEAKRVGLMVDLFTNGTMITDRLAAFFSENANLISVSLDGPELHHDRLRGVSGSYARTMEGLEKLYRHNAHIALQCMITPDNIRNLDWLNDLKQQCIPMMIKLGHVSAMGRGRFQKSLMFQNYNELKEVAKQLSGTFNHYHTRILTNIISSDELKAFYPSFDAAISPWLLSDGQIIACYTYEQSQYWTISNAEIYPEMMPESAEKVKLLAQRAYACAQKAEHFDLLQLLSETAEEIAKEKLK